ncbi:hypothetical protein BaRGS_00020144 [Batillaria attramentaria]|uniref:Uncharacterized protein n=1 Tax=Batillaria attramentaria TaxID=370345 RepID=A0ABD0KP39_9CAEN
MELSAAERGHHFFCETKLKPTRCINPREALRSGVRKKTSAEARGEGRPSPGDKRQKRGGAGGATGLWFDSPGKNSQTMAREQTFLLSCCTQQI